MRHRGPGATDRAAAERFETWFAEMITTYLRAKV